MAGCALDHIYDLVQLGATSMQGRFSLVKWQACRTTS